jgi:hypothetical protein
MRQRLHDARHTVATLLIGQGVHIRVVQEILGHARVTTTERYAHVASPQPGAAHVSDNGEFGVPILPGYTVTWDDEAGEWLARSTEFDATLRGKSQAELEAARWQLALRLAEELQQIIRHAPQHGYSPPRGAAE